MARVSRANLLIGCITGAALLLRLPGFTESLWFDEIWSTRVILGGVASTVRMLSADLHPPVFNLLMFVWIRIFGDSEISVRLLPLICGLATVVLTARLAIDYGWRSAAPVAALGLVGQRRFYIERSALTILPFFAVSIAVGATSLSRAVWRASAVALIAVFGAVILINYYAKRDQWTVYKPKADWRGAAARMADEQSRLGRPVVVVAMGPALELRYYNAGFGPESLDPPAPSPHTSAFRERLKRLFEVPVDPRRGTTAKVYEIYEPDVTLVQRIFAREQTGEIILVRNALTVDWSTTMIALLKADPRLRIEPLSETKGIRIFRVSQDASAAVH